MFGGEIDEAKTAEAAKIKTQQQAAQRERELTDPGSQGSQSSALSRGDLNSGNRPSERPPEEAAKDEAIRNAITSYFGRLPQEEEDALASEIAARLFKSEFNIEDAGIPVTEELRIRLINEIITNIDVRNKAAQQQVIQPATVTHLVATSVVAQQFPPPPPKESAFERQKNEVLLNLQKQITGKKSELASHEATEYRLREEYKRHQGNVSKANLDLENFKAINPFTGYGLRFGLTEHSRQLLDQKDRLEKAYNDATQVLNQFVARTNGQLQAAKSSIATLPSLIQSLEREHERVAASEDPVIVEQRQKEAAAARAKELEQQRAARAIALEKQRQKDLEDAKAASLAQRQRIEDQLAAEKASSFTTASMSEVERLQEQISKAHEAVTKVRKTIKESVKLELESWRHYFNLAENRSRLKQRLSILMSKAAEPVFKRSVEDALFLKYKDALYNCLGDNLAWTSFPKQLEDLYDRNGIHTMDDYHDHATIQELERPLTQHLQEARQRDTMKVLKAELAVIASEEHPQLLQQIEECVWQNMTGFSSADRKKATAKVYNAAARRAFQIEQTDKYYGLAYTREQQGADWWRREGQQQAIQRQQQAIQRSYNFTQQQLNANWNAQQNSMFQSSIANGGYYQPNYRW